MADRSTQVLSRLRRSGLGLVGALLLSCSASSAFGAAATGFYSLPPCRIADTRGASRGSLGRPSVAALSARSFVVRRLCGLPDNATAVSLNVTVTGPTGSGDLRLFPGGTTEPVASVINYAPGQTRANNSIIPIGADGSIVVKSDQPGGVVDLILDVNGYFVVSPDVPTPPGLSVKIRPATEVELTFDNVTSAAGTTAVQVLEFTDNRTVPTTQSLKAFFPNGSPEQALVPDILVPDYVVGLGKGGPTGPPTFLLALIDTKNLAFSRTAEFHGLEDFRLGWDPPCVVLTDRTQEPRTFFGRDATEASLVEESGGPVFVDISSGCGSNKGSGWNFSAYLTGRDTRTPDVIAGFMVARLKDVLTSQSNLITNPTVATNLMNDAQAAITNVGLATPAGFTSALANMADFIGIVDGNPGAFDNTSTPRNMSGELAGRAQAATT